jgi:hypothetical protein
MTQVLSQDQRIAQLERLVMASNWVKIGEAAKILNISESTLRRRCQLKRYRQAWRWNDTKTQRLFNVHLWMEAGK